MALIVLPKRCNAIVTKPQTTRSHLRALGPCGAVNLFGTGGMGSAGDALRAFPSASREAAIAAIFSRVRAEAQTRSCAHLAS